MSERQGSDVELGAGRAGSKYDRLLWKLVDRFDLQTRQFLRCKQRREFTPMFGFAALQYAICKTEVATE